MTAPDTARHTASDASSAFTPLTLVAADGARAAVLPYGAHVVGWTPAPTAPGGAVERLFVSADAVYRVGTAVRGGVPVIFPQFFDRVAGAGPSIRHGFARTRPWNVVRTGHAADGAAEAVLALTDAPDTRDRWPHAFRAELVVRVTGATLEVTLAVENPGDAALAFTGALHTYLRVDDVTAAQVRGLEAPVAFGETVDRLFFAVPGPVMLGEPARALQIAQTGFRDVVVWNPGPDGAAAFADLEPDGWRRFACVEAVAADAITVAPGARWEGTQHLTCVPPHPGGR